MIGKSSVKSTIKPKISSNNGCGDKDVGRA